MNPNLTLSPDQGSWNLVISGHRKTMSACPPWESTPSSNSQLSESCRECSMCRLVATQTDFESLLVVENGGGRGLTSTRWLSGPYRSLSSSMTRLLKNDENFLFNFPGWRTERERGQSQL